MSKTRPDPPRGRSREAPHGPRPSSGDIVGRAMGVYFRGIVPIFLLAVILYVPVVGIAFGLVVVNPPDSTPVYDARGRLIDVRADWTNLYILLVAVALWWQALAAAVTYSVFQTLRKARAGLGTCLARGFSRLLPTFAVGLVTIAILGLCFSPSLLARTPWYVVLLEVVAFLYMATVLSVAVPSAVVENPGVIGALVRSATLTRGCRWTVFASMLLVFLLWILLSWLVQTVLNLAFARGTLTLQIATMAAVLALLPLMAVAQAVVYHDLRRAKEGIGVEDLAKVFD